jgi:hypothetical protein
MFDSRHNTGVEKAIRSIIRPSPLRLRPPTVTESVVLPPDRERAMTEYRAYLVGLDGHFVGFEPLLCADDAEATEKAARLAGTYGVELWSGPRLITHVRQGSKNSSAQNIEWN